MAPDDSPMPTGRGPVRQPDPSGEPGRKYDHLSSAGEGPGQTPLEDVIPGILLVVFAVFMIPLAIVLAFSTIAAFIAVLALGIVFLALGIWLIRRGSKRWAWRKANIHLTGGRYLNPWEKTPDSY